MTYKTNTHVVIALLLSHVVTAMAWTVFWGQATSSLAGNEVGSRVFALISSFIILI